jgi:hypothetical protein
MRGKASMSQRSVVSRLINSLAEIIKRVCPTTPYLASMQRKTAHIDIRVEPQLIERIDAWRGRQRVPPSRSAAIVHMIEDFLEREQPPDTPVVTRA